MQLSLAAGLFLTTIGLIALAFGVYALLRGGRRPEDRDHGGLGPFSERGIHVVAGIRMTLIGLLSLATGGYFLWTAF